MGKNGFEALLEIGKKENIKFLVGSIFYSAYNKLEIKRLHGEIKREDITEEAIREEARKIQHTETVSQEQKKQESSQLTSSEHVMTPSEFAEAVYRGETFYDRVNHVEISIFGGVDIEGNLKGLTEDGRIIKTNAKNLTIAGKKADINDSQVLNDFENQVFGKGR